MRVFTFALIVLALPGVVRAENVWRWKDARGALHYTNIGEGVPADATAVKTRITIEADRLPGAPAGPALALVEGQAVDTGASASRPSRAAGRPAPKQRSKWAPEAPRIYDEARLRFGCYTGNVLWGGGFSHADDIAPVLDCSAYRLGPEAWLNSARAELAVRQNGISVRDMVQLYAESRSQQ